MDKAVVGDKDIPQRLVNVPTALVKIQLSVDGPRKSNRTCTKSSDLCHPRGMKLLLSNWLSLGTRGHYASELGMKLARAL